MVCEAIPCAALMLEGRCGAGGAKPRKMPFKERNCGTLGDDPKSPGLLKEAACIRNINHTIGSLDTQMVTLTHRSLYL